MKTCENKYSWRHVQQVKGVSVFPCCVLCTRTPAFLNHFYVYSDVLVLYIVYASENANTVWWAQRESNGIAPLTFELGFKSQGWWKSFAVFYTECNARYQNFWSTGKLKRLSAMELGDRTLTGLVSTGWGLHNGHSELCQDYWLVILVVYMFSQIQSWNKKCLPQRVPRERIN